MTRVRVTGVRGRTGAPLAPLLARDGVEVLGGGSDPATVGLDGVRPVHFSWDDPAGATDGVDAVSSTTARVACGRDRRPPPQPRVRPSSPAAATTSAGPA